MRVKSLLTESYECVKIGGILRNLSNDEMKIYKKVKSEGRVFKMDLPEYDANVATTMVSKGLLRRKKAQQDEGHGRIYYTTIGRKGNIRSKEIDEVAPPGKESEKWIRKNKKRFKEKYGKDYEKYLYGKAWNNYNGKKKINESYDKARKLNEEGLNAVKEFIEEYILLRNKVEQNESNIYDEYVVRLKDVAEDLYQYFPMNNGAGVSYDIEEAINTEWSTLRDSAVEQCDEYTVYNRGAYKAEETWDKIDSMHGIIWVMRTYGSHGENKEWAEDFINALEQVKNDYAERNSEPTFDGNFDNVEVANETEESEDYAKTMKNLTEFCNKMKEAANKSDPLGWIEDCYDNNFYKLLADPMYVDKDIEYAVDDCYNDLKRNGYSFVDSSLSDEDYDFIVRGDDEYDSEGTWDNVCEEDFETLFRKCGTREEAKEFLENLYRPFEYLCNTYGKQLGKENVIPQNSSEDEDSGSEFDE